MKKHGNRSVSGNSGMLAKSCRRMFAVVLSLMVANPLGVTTGFSTAVTAYAEEAEVVFESSDTAEPEPAAEEQSVIFEEEAPEAEAVSEAEPAAEQAFTDFDDSLAAPTVEEDFADGVSDSKVAVNKTTGADYDTVQAAINAASNGDTIVLTAASSSTETITIEASKSITLNLNGNTFESSENPAIKVEGSLTITDDTATEPSVSGDGSTVTYSGGMIEHTGSGSAIKVESGGSVTLMSGEIYSEGGNGIYAIGDKSVTDREEVPSTVTISGGYVDAQEFGVGVRGLGATANITGGVVVGRDNAALAGNGTKDSNADNGGTTMNVSGGTLIGKITTSGYIACGIYHPQAGTLNISGGTITAVNGVGVLMRAGTLKMTGGTVTATGNSGGKVGDSSIISNCYGIYVDGTSNYPGISDGGLSATITDGYVKTADGVAALELTKTTGSTTVKEGLGKITVIGGTFDTEPEEDEIPSGYHAEYNSSNNTWSIVKDIVLISQTIKIADPGTKTYGDKAFTLTLSSTGSGSGSVTWRSSDSAILAIDGTTATIKGAGAVKITAIKAADSTYSSAYATFSLEIGKLALTVTPDSGKKTYGEEDPALTYAVSSSLGTNSAALAYEDKLTDILTGEIARTAGEDVGTYDVEQGTLKLTDTGAENYTLTFVKGSFEIVAAAQSAPEGLVPADGSCGGKADCSISGLKDSMEIAASENGTYKKLTELTTEDKLGTYDSRTGTLSGLVPGTYYVRYAADSNHGASSASAVTVTSAAHDWKKTVYTWSADGKSCTAARTCASDSSHEETTEAKVTSKVTKESTCAKKGQTTYTAEFEESWAETQTKVISDVAKKAHTYGSWKITKTATVIAYGEKQRTCKVCGHVEKKSIAKRTTPAFMLAWGRVAGDKSITVSWKKVNGASGYEVYGNYCNGKALKLLKRTSDTSYTQKNLKKNGMYKYQVKAYTYVSGKKVYLAASPAIHVAMRNNAKTNVSQVTSDTSNISLKKEGTFKLKVSCKKRDSKKALLAHASKYRFYTSDNKVASVNSSGKITAKNCGTCYVYAVANNGFYKTIKVTVK